MKSSDIETSCVEWQDHRWKFRGRKVKVTRKLSAVKIPDSYVPYSRHVLHAFDLKTFAYEIKKIRDSSLPDIRSNCKNTNTRE